MEDTYTDHRSEALKQLDRADHYLNSDGFHGDRHAFVDPMFRSALVHAVLHVAEMVAALVDDARART
jgi:hypothetical protein